MATYFTDDFADFPADWTERFNTAGNWSVSSGELTHAAGASNVARLLSWNDIDADADRDDIEILHLTKSLSFGTSNYWSLVRGSGGEDTELGYTTRVTSSTFTVYKGNGDGTFTSVGSVSQSQSVDVYYWVRLRVIGTSIKARCWEDGSSEPGTWGIDTTDSSISGVGWAGPFTNGSASGSRITGQFGVGTNGDTAPATAGGGNDGIGSAAGTSTANAIAGFVGQAAGTGTPYALSGSEATAAGSSTAAALSGSVGQADGAGAATAVSESGASVASAAGTSTAAAFSGSIAQASGTATASGLSSAATGIGAAAGTSTATALSGSIASATGAATATALSASTAAVASATGTATVVGIAGSIGAAAGSSTTAALRGSAGTAAGTSTVVAFPGSVASAAGTATAAAVGGAIAQSTGTSTASFLWLATSSTFTAAGTATVLGRALTAAPEATAILRSSTKRIGVATADSAAQRIGRRLAA